MKRVALFLLLMIIAPIAAAQTSVTGRIETGVLALRPVQCAPGDYYSTTDTFTLYACGPTNTWVTLGVSVIGAVTTGHCAQFAGPTSLSDSGAPCGGGGGGSGTVIASPQFQIAYFSSAGTVASVKGATLTTDTSGDLTIPANTTIGGPEPWIDITSAVYGARAVTSTPTTTVSCVASSASATIAADPGFVNGDGIVAAGCGPTATVAAPGTITVTPVADSGAMDTGRTVTGASGSTTYTYQVRSVDKAEGVSAAATGTTTTGVATLGPQAAVTNTSLTRSSQTVSVVTSAAHGLPIGCSPPNCPLVFVANSTDASFDGFFMVASVADGTHYTYTQGIDTRNQSSGAISATGGTTTVYLDNKISWAAVSGAWQYLVCDNAGNAIGLTRPGELVFQDYGPTVEASFPMPAAVKAACGVAGPTNDYLATTIVSGAGTTSLTFANAATNNSSASAIVLDDGQALVKSFLAAGVNGTSPGTLRIPAAAKNSFYPISSHSVLVGDGVTVQQAGRLQLKETVEVPGNTTWSGENGGSAGSSPQFAWSNAQQIQVTTAFPGMAVSSAQTKIDHIAFTVSNAGLGLTIANGTDFNVTLSYDSFTVGNSTDYIGMGVVTYGITNMQVDHSLFLGNDAPSFGYSTAPLYLDRNDIAEVNGAGSIHCIHCYVTGRGLVVDTNPFIGSGSSFIFDELYGQAVRTPMLMMDGVNNPLVEMVSPTNDTSSTAYLANWGTNGMVAILRDVASLSVETGGGGRPGFVTGNDIPGLFVTNSGNTISPTGQNRDQLWCQGNQAMSIPVFSPNTVAASYVCFQDVPWSVGPGYSMFWRLPPPSNITVATSSGGSVPVGTLNYAVSAIGFDGGETVPSSSVLCTTTSGNQTCTPSWNNDPDAAFYNVYRGNSSGSVVTNGVVSCTHVPAGTLSCADTAPAMGGHSPVAATGTGTTTMGARSVITPGVRTDLLNQRFAGQFAGAVTLSGGTGTFSFPTAYTNAPICTASDKTALQPVQASSTASTLTLTGTSTDVVNFICVGNPN